MRHLVRTQGLKIDPINGGFIPARFRFVEFYGGIVTEHIAQAIALSIDVGQGGLIL